MSDRLPLRGLGLAAALALSSVAVGQGFVPETIGETTLGVPQSSWFIVKGGLGSAYVFDAAEGGMLGTLSLTPPTPTLRRHAERGEIYAAETHYSRRTRGERSDMLRIYTHETLSPVAEVPLPKDVGTLHRHYLGIIEGSAYVAVFHMTPAQSVSIVNVDSRRFVGEISTPGCALTLPAGERGFLMICGDGTLQWIGLDEDGGEAARVRSERVFSVEDDPLFDEPAPTAAGWQFASFEGLTMEAVVEDGQIQVRESWSMLGEEDDGWRPGGSQPLAYDAGSDVLVSLMHEGGKDTQDEAGTEAWLFHRAAERRIGRIKFEDDATASNIQVVQGDEQPLLLASIGGSVHVFELDTGKRQRVIETGRGGYLLPY